MESLKIVALSIFAAITYGIIHDQITARICVEYFTIGHPPIFGTDSPTLLGLGWGIVATWWVGLLLGIPLSLMAQIGSMPKIGAASLIKPIAVLMMGSAIVACIAGVIGFSLARTHSIWLVGSMATKVPQSRQELFLVDLWIHNASYLASFIGGMALIYWTWRRRYLLMHRAMQARVHHKL
ncbi:MAG: hypothetical protein JO316_22415 [Abitibacteriaceae bacterium]|nr:hypothetical protein [Abditibacteriaceae bacterium]